jgi:hypothetical protein
MKVEITDLRDFTLYYPAKEEDCRDETDREVYRLCLEHDTIITMGCVIGKPVQEALPCTE